MKRIGTLIALASCSLVAGASLPSASQGNADEVIALEKGALDRWASGDVHGFLSLYADDITYFDPTQERRIEGTAALRATYEPLQGKFKVDRYEMLLPKVQRSGNVAVLTYMIQNYAKQPDGTEKPTSRWNVTEVFRRDEARWRTIHSHFSFTKPDIRPQ